MKQWGARVKEPPAKEDPSRTVISEQEVLEREWRNVDAILEAYRFTGLSGKLTSRGVCMCISTAFEGNLLDSYFVDLVIEKTTPDSSPFRPSLHPSGKDSRSTPTD